MDWGDWLGVVGTVSHMGGHSRLPMWLVVGQALILCRQGRGGLVGCVVSSPHYPAALWILP